MRCLANVTISKFWRLIWFLLFLHQVSYAFKPAIYIYADEGVDRQFLQFTQQTFRNLVGERYLVKTIQAQAVAKGAWVKDAKLLIIPGGADLPYVRKLKGAGIAAIQRYVEQGGSYLGICAGGYFASSYVEFDKNGQFEVLGERDLKFFPGKAIGPILAPFDYKSNSGSRAAKIQLDVDSQQTIHLYFNGGSYFADATAYPGVQVLGWYTNLAKPLPAIIALAKGRGRVVLSGVHFEIAASQLNPDNPYLKVLIPKLAADEQERITLIKKLLRYLNVL